MATKKAAKPRLSKAGREKIAAAQRKRWEAKQAKEEVGNLPQSFAPKASDVQFQPMQQAIADKANAAMIGGALSGGMAGAASPDGASVS